MKDSKITINGIPAPGVELENAIDGSWRVAGTVDGLAPLHVGDEYLIRAMWRENRVGWVAFVDGQGPTQERVGWARLIALDDYALETTPPTPCFVTFDGMGPLYAPIERETREDSRADELADQLARTRKLVSELRDRLDANVMPGPHVNDVRTALAVALIGAWGTRNANVGNLPRAIFTLAREMADELTREDDETCQTSGQILSGAESDRPFSEPVEPATGAGTGEATT